jgi:hypothetical protein
MNPEHFSTTKGNSSAARYIHALVLVILVFFFLERVLHGDSHRDFAITSLRSVSTSAF